MANWLLDYIEMTEYIPSELREQLTSIRELDLQVHNAMDELERDIKQFFSKINTLSQQERQDQYDAFLKKCDVATKAASDKVKVADKLHDLVEMSMRLLDQGLEKLKEDLLECDKAYVVEDLERRSQELDEQMRLEHETMLQRQKKLQELKTHSKSQHHHHKFTNSNSDESNSNHVNNNNSQTNNHRHSLPAQQSLTTSSSTPTTATNHHQNTTNHHHNHHKLSNTTTTPATGSGSTTTTNTTNTHHRVRNNSTGVQNSSSSVGRQKKRERKRLNSSSTMTIFNRNSRSDDGDSTNQSFISSPLTPEYLASQLKNSSRTLNDVVAGSGNNTSSLTTMKGMMAGNRNHLGTGGAGLLDRINGNDPLAGAKQPILTAIDAAHAVSPNATNSDKLVLFSSNPNGDNNYNLTHNTASAVAAAIGAGSTSAAAAALVGEKQNHLINPLGSAANPTYQQNQLSGHLLSTMGFNSGDSTTMGNNIAAVGKSDQLRFNHDQNHHHHHHHKSGAPFSAHLPLSSRHDPIMMAASQAINATQNMTPGRRTSSLKASYAAVNSGRLQPAPSQQLFGSGEQGMVHEVYCNCRSHIQGSNMIACDNSKCRIEWFHYECVGITTPPEGEWYCDECKVSLGIQKGHKQPKLEGVNVT